MTRRQPYFKGYSSDFLNGIFGLKPVEVAAYFAVILVQYDTGERVPFEGHERELGLRVGMREDRMKKSVLSLVAKGKLRLENGAVWNARAASEISKYDHEMNAKRDASSRGGIATRARWGKKPNKNNEPYRPSGLATLGQTLGQMASLELGLYYKPEKKEGETNPTSEPTTAPPALNGTPRPDLPWTDLKKGLSEEERLPGLRPEQIPRPRRPPPRARGAA